MEMNSTTDESELFVDNQPMNDEELTKLHESTLQMFRSNKIGPKNAFDIVLIDYLPAIFEGTSFEDDHMNNFQSVGTTLETSAKIYAARIDSLYSETRKTQSILRSNNENFNRILDEEEDTDGLGETDDETSQRRVSNNKKIRLLMKRKKSIVTDRNKLLRKNRNDEFRPIMINQFFLSAMHNDNTMLSELYDKISRVLIIDERNKTNKNESNDILSTSLNSNDFVCDSLFVDTSNSAIITNGNDSSPRSETTKFSQLLTPNSLISSSPSTMNLTNTPIRSRTNSISSNSSILTNAANLLTDTPDEYSYLDSSKVNAFINEINNNQILKLDDVVVSPVKLVRKRRLSIEYPFPFLVEQAKKQRMTPKKLREKFLLRPPSPEYLFTPFDTSFDSNSDIFMPPNSPNSQLSDVIPANSSLSISKRQRAIDFRHLQTKMQRMIGEHFTHEKQLDFSHIYSHIHQDEQRTITSVDIGICFAALLNNAVRYQFKLESNDLRDDINIISPNIN